MERYNNNNDNNNNNNNNNNINDNNFIVNLLYNNIIVFLELFQCADINIFNTKLIWLTDVINYINNTYASVV
jgi:hypothetical protein